MKVLFKLGQYPGPQTLLALEGLWQNLKGPTSEAGAASVPEVEISSTAAASSLDGIIVLGFSWKGTQMVTTLRFAKCQPGLIYLNLLAVDRESASN